MSGSLSIWEEMRWGDWYKRLGQIWAGLRGRSPGTSPVARPPWSRQGQSVLEVLQAGDGGSPWHVVRRSGEVSSQLGSVSSVYWGVVSLETPGQQVPASGVVVDPVEGGLLDIEYDRLLPAAHHLTQVNDGAHICRGRVQAGGGGGHLKPVSWSEKEPFLSDSPHTELLTPERKMTSQREMLGQCMVNLLLYWEWRLLHPSDTSQWSWWVDW